MSLPVDAGEWRTDFDRATVDMSEILSGGPPKDGIPAIDEPRFVGQDEAAQWLHPDEPVIVLRLDGEARAYPLQILMFHEIVNDEFQGVPVAVTFCPLCNAAIAYDRRVSGQVLDFGTTGRLRNSDLVMYDRQTESWWQQITGNAIVGEFAGTALRQIPAGIISYADFRRASPQAMVLSRDTGWSRAYGRNPYRGYDSIKDRPFLFDKETDPRLPPMERVLSVRGAQVIKLYTFTALRRETVVNDVLEGREIVAFSKPGTLSVLDRSTISDSRRVLSANAFSRVLEDGRTLEFAAQDGAIVDLDSGSHWNLLGEAVSGPLRGAVLRPLERSGVHFAFAWLAFHPDSEIYR